MIFTSLYYLYYRLVVVCYYIVYTWDSKRPSENKKYIWEEDRGKEWRLFWRKGPLLLGLRSPCPLSPCHSEDHTSSAVTDETIPRTRACVTGRSHPSVLSRNHCAGQVCNMNIQPLSIGLLTDFYPLYYQHYTCIIYKMLGIYIVINWSLERKIRQAEVNVRKDIYNVFGSL